MRSRKIVPAPMPDGLFYVPDFISVEEEQVILNQIDQLPFSPYIMGNYEAKRTVVQYGGQEYRVNYGGNQPMDILPSWIDPVRERCASIIRASAQDLEQILVARYENAGIGWHRDAPQFGPTVIGLSLGSANTMRFRRLKPDLEELFRIELAPRSLYVMSGDARSVWQHSMPQSKQLRYSLTFRTINVNLKKSSIRQGDCGTDTRQQPRSIAERLAELSMLSRSASSGMTQKSESARPERPEAVTQLRLLFPG